MSLATRSTLSYAIDESVTEVAFASLFEEPMLWPSLFPIRVSNKKQEVVASFGELSEYAIKNEGAEATEDTPIQQFKSTFIHTAYAKILRVTRELIDDEEWGAVEDFGMQLGQKAAETMESKAASLFNDAFDGASFTGEDSLSLCNDAHLNVDSANSQDNSLALALSFANVKTARSTMRKFKGYDSAQRLNVIPDELMVPVDLEEDAWVLVASSQKPGTANNDANMFSGRYTVYTWPWLTDTNAWFMMDSRLRRRYLRYYQRIPLEILSDASFSQGVRKIGGYMRFSLGFTNWRFIIGSNPS